MENNDKLVEINYQPYIKRKYIFSVAELKFFELLKEIIGDNYYIFPKVRICDIIESKNKSSYSNFNKIKSKHIDFLLCTKNPITSKIIIELDDKSHSTPIRQARDKFVDEIFANAEIPIVHIKVQYVYNKENVKQKLQEAYRTKYIIKEKAETINKNLGCGTAVLFIFLLSIIIIII